MSKTNTLNMAELDGDFRQAVVLAYHSLGLAYPMIPAHASRDTVRCLLNSAISGKLWGERRYEVEEAYPGTFPEITENAARYALGHDPQDEQARAGFHSYLAYLTEPLSPRDFDPVYDPVTGEEYVPAPHEALLLMGGKVEPDEAMKRLLEMAYEEIAVAGISWDDDAPSESTDPLIKPAPAPKKKEKRPSVAEKEEILVELLEDPVKRALPDGELFALRSELGARSTANRILNKTQHERLIELRKLRDAEKEDRDQAQKRGGPHQAARGLTRHTSGRTSDGVSLDGARLGELGRFDRE